jgi:hypothetical protein
MKKILLQTMPHTGTHTMHYLFNVLGGIDVIWHHWEHNCLEDIVIAKNLDWSDLVLVRTHRDSLETLESCEGRATSREAGQEYYENCREIFYQNRRSFPRPIIIEIGNKERATAAALDVFRACEVEPSEEALDYMKSWKRIGSQHDKEAPSKAIKQSINRGRVSTWHTN